MEPGLVLRNGRFHTMDAAAPLAEAVAIRGGRLLAVGTEADARAALPAAAEVRDLGGRCVLPGLIDAHLHLKWYAESRAAVPVETSTRDEAVARVAARAAASPPGAWITGSGWNHNVWGAGSLPGAAPLDAAAPRNPVALKAKSGHALWVNSLALKAAGIGLATPDPPGGQIAHDSHGMPSGVLLENAMDLVLSLIPAPDAAGLALMLRDAQSALHRVGLTGVHDFDSLLVLQALEVLEERGDLTLRVVKGIPHECLDQALGMGLRSGFGGALIVMGHVKMFADGALGPQTAWMIAPYEGTWNTGVSTLTEEQLTADVGRANAAGLSCAVHAIGDAACHVVLNAFQAAGEASRAAGRAPARNRMEHAQLLHQQDMPRFARLGVTASMQPIHATSDMLIADRSWGARCGGAYAWRSLLETGAALAFGSDCPVEIPDPLAGIHAAVTRRRGDGTPGPDGWRPEQRLTVDQAVRAYTLGAAAAGFREKELGSIAPGKRADLTILSADIYALPAHEIHGVTAAATVVAGRFVHDAL